MRSATEPRARSFNVVTAVWGPEYRQLFLDVCVPNQLTPGNLGALPAGSRYKVFTSRDDAEVLRSSPVLRQVNDLMPVDVVVVPELSAASRSKFTRESACHRRAVMDARESGVALIFVCPDHVVSEGAFAAAVRRHEAGSRAVVCPGIRVERDAFLAALHASGGVRGVPPRKVVSVALDHLHPSSRAQIVDSERSARHLIGVYWNVPGEGLLARCFRLHPIMVDPLRRDVPLEDTIDGHYVRRSCPIRDHVHVVSDSDELVLFEMSHVDASGVGTAPRTGLAWRAAAVMRRCDSHQQSYWHAPIRLHVRDIGEAWRAAEEQSARFAGRVVTIYKARRWLTFRHLHAAWRDSMARQHLRRAAKRLSGRRRRAAVLLAHSARQAHQWRKRVARVARRTARRARAAVFLVTQSVARPR